MQEEREDELMKEKRKLGKEVRNRERCPALDPTSLPPSLPLTSPPSPPQIRSYQSESEDYKTEIDLLKRRIEQLQKRRDYGLDS